MKIIIIIVLCIISILFIVGCGAPQKIKVDSLEITNIYRNCEKDNSGNYIDTTIQTNVNIDVEKTKKYSLKLTQDDCILQIGPNEHKGFAINKVPVVINQEGITESGLYQISGGELSGDRSEILTFCCQDACDTQNIEICE